MYGQGKLALMANIGKQIREKIELILNDLMDYDEVVNELNSYKLFDADFNKIADIVKNDPSTLTVLKEVDIPLEPLNLTLSPKINPESNEARTRNIIMGVDSSWIKPDPHIKPLISLMNIAVFIYAPQIITGGYRIENIIELKIGKELFVKRGSQKVIGRIMRDVDLEVWQFELIESLMEKIAYEINRDKPMFLFYDGSLSMLYAGNYSTDDQELLVESMRRFLNDMKKLNIIPIGVYHSLSRGLLNVLVRGVICASEPSCYRCIVEKGDDAPCFKYNMISDKNLFLKRLKIYERSPIFQVHNLILEHNRNLNIKGFYIKVDDNEIMRVEMPNWAISYIDDIHLSVAAQASLSRRAKGRGYPYVLLRAHENAVLRNIDKEMILNLIDEELKKIGKEKNTPLSIRRTGKEFYKKYGII